MVEEFDEAVRKGEMKRKIDEEKEQVIRVRIGRKREN